MKKLGFLAIALCASSAMSATVIEHKGGTLKAYSNGKAVIKFWGDWCSACKAIGPRFASLSDDNKYKDIRFVAVDCGKFGTLVDQYKISGIPAFLFMDHGTIVDRMVGNNPGLLIQKLDKFIK